MVRLGVGLVTLVVVALTITNVALRRVSGTHPTEQERLHRVRHAGVGNAPSYSEWMNEMGSSPAPIRVSGPPSCAVFDKAMDAAPVVPTEIARLVVARDRADDELAADDLRFDEYVEESRRGAPLRG